MSEHQCLPHLVVVHAEGSDTPHILEGVLCPCLPRSFCAICDLTFTRAGQPRQPIKTTPGTQHVYPSWQEALET